MPSPEPRRSAHRVGPRPPKPGQIAHLKRLCEATGQRYVAPRDSRQAAARITDLQARLKGARRPADAPPTPRDDFLRLLGHLKRACNASDPDPRRIAALERRISAIVEGW